MAAEAALQAAIIDFATSSGGAVDPVPVALELLRLAEGELFDDPPDLRRGDRAADRRSGVRGAGLPDRRAHRRKAAAG
jgi:hypothetical protein